jgi:two-component system NtrC family sensor kinase
MDATRDQIASPPHTPAGRPDPVVGGGSAWRMLDHVVQTYDARSPRPESGAWPGPGADAGRPRRGVWVLLLVAPAAPLLVPAAASVLGAGPWLVLALGLAAAGLSVGLAVWGSARLSRRLAAVDRDRAALDDKVVETGKLASIGLLAAGVAHEINNPLAIMIEEAGWIEDLLGDPEPAGAKNLAELKRAAAQIKAQGQRCRGITHELLSFARKSDDRSVAVDLADLVRRVVRLLEQKRRYTAIRIETDLSPATPAVTGAPQELEQVLFNLVGNALDAVDPDSGQVTIRTGARDGRAMIEIVDNGSGIEAANLPRIFDPFFTTKPAGQGVGLGLSICFGIVRRLGGTIEVASRPGRGTTFTVTLPARGPDESPREDR